ncbi:hypothetical protein BC828DRAFT_393680 [Blastocladiella britannica]|nr:hypothetical protein BC828DRAFT_393680 [Blastocladiella britannica]
MNKFVSSPLLPGNGIVRLPPLPLDKKADVATFKALQAARTVLGTRVVDAAFTAAMARVTPAPSSSPAAEHALAEYARVAAAANAILREINDALRQSGLLNNDKATELEQHATRIQQLERERYAATLAYQATAIDNARGDRDRAGDVAAAWAARESAVTAIVDALEDMQAWIVDDFSEE